jgi:SSS family solute:Na+ symporter
MFAVLGTIVGLSKVASCAIGAAVVTTYFTAGGLKSSVAVNVLQVGVKLLGFALAVPLALAAVGGVDGFHHAFPRGPYWSGWSNGSSGWVYLATLGPAFIVSPGILQKVFGARDDRAVRIGVGVNALVLLLFAPVPAILGMITRALLPDLDVAAQALPTLFMNDLPFWVGALGLAAIFSAELSAADALLFMLATSFSHDIYKRFVNRGADDAQVVRVARLAAVAGGALAFVLAVGVAKDILDALGIFYVLLSVSLFVPIVAGVFSGRGDAVAALAAIAGGVLLAAGVHLGSEPGLFRSLTPLWGILLAAVAYMMAGALTARKPA